MRPEHALLLKAAQAALGTGRPAEMRALLHRGVDEAALLEAARHHGATALLYKGLYPVAEAAPEALRHRLRAAFHAGAVRSRLHLRELGTLAEALADEGVPLISLKGPVLAVQAYGEAGLRPAGDLDILVPRADVPRVRRLLLERGYATPVASADEPARLRSQLGYEFVKDGLCVEVHWAFLPRTLAFRLDPEGAWRRAERAGVEGAAAVHTLAFEDRMLFLCAHGAKHGWDRLKWICDVAALLRGCTEADARCLLRHAARLQSRRPLLLGCTLAQDLLGAELPPPLAEAARRDAAMPELAGHVRRHLFSRAARDDAVHHRAFFLLATRERWRDRLPYVLHLARLALRPTARDRAFLPLPPSLHALYYAVRPVRLAADWFCARPGHGQR